MYTQHELQRWHVLRQLLLYGWIDRQINQFVSQCFWRVQPASAEPVVFFSLFT